MRPFRARINQPSTLQPLHKMDGKKGILVKEKDGSLTMYFVDGELISMQVDPLWISALDYQKLPTS